MSELIPPTQAQWRKYAVAVLVTLAVLVLRLTLPRSITGDRPLLILFVIPMLVSAYLGGLGPGLVSTALIEAVTPFLAFPARGLAVARPLDFTQWLILLATGTLISAMSEALHRARRRAEAAAQELRQTERSLRESQELLRAISDNSTAVIYAKDLDGRYLMVNRRYLELFHVNQQTVLGRTDQDLFPKADADAIRALDERVATAGVALTEEEAVPYDDGSHTYLSMKAPLRDATGKIYGVFGISTDISEHKRAEAALQTSEERTRLIVETALDAVITIDCDGIVTGWNAQAEKTFGWTASEVQGRSLAQTIIPPQYRVAHAEGMARYLATGEGRVLNRRIELTALHRGGHEFPIELAITPLRVDGKLSFSAFVRDIGERKRAESKLQAQLAQLHLLHQITRAIGERQDLQSIFQVVVRSLEDNLPIDLCCLCVYDATDSVLTVARVGVHSEALATELALAERAKIPIDENGLSRCVRGHLVYEPDLAGVPFPFPQRLARAGLRSLVFAPLLVESKVFGVFVGARRTANGFTSGECEFLKQLSEHTALAAHQAQLYAALQQAYDDLRQTQQVVMQQERLRALGQMASGIAHDINNAISPVSLYVESILENEKNLSAQSRDGLVVVGHAIEDVSNTVARLREFYRQKEPQLALSSLRLNRTVEQVIDLTRARWFDMPQRRGAVVELRRDLQPSLPPVMAIESEIREALINLVFNAVDAMPDGGMLTLRTRTIARRRRDHGAEADEFVAVEVEDTGIGMDEETQRRCLEPFFTTKGERGTGLGLAMVYGIARRHGADLEIDSALGRGTTVRLVFAAAAAPTTSNLAATIGRPACLRLLIVDDDPLLLKSLRDILEADGHTVATANGGEAGINAFRTAVSERLPFAAVITDLGMPYVDGRKVSSAVKEMSPTTPVILLTGWGQRLVEEVEIPPHVDRVLSKPPKLRELRDALAAASVATPL